MIQKYSRFIIGIAILVIICVGLTLATYTVKPGQTALLLRGGAVTAVYSSPGLHWKVPLLQSVVWLDTRTHLSEGRVRLSADTDKGLAARYLVLWRVVEPRLFYRTTGGDATAFHNQLDAALTPVLRQTMTAGSARDFLIGSADPLLFDLRAGAQNVAGKDGIAVLDVKLGAAELPAQLVKQTATTMAAGIRTQIAAARAAGTAERRAIAAQAAAKSATLLAEARRQAATIRGKSQARVTALYAPAARRAPDFFRYFLSLQSEADALKKHTRVLVISMDSPWFRTLEDAAEHRSQ